jgi:hypothetical protein
MQIKLVTEFASVLQKLEDMLLSHFYKNITHAWEEGKALISDQQTQIKHVKERIKSQISDMNNTVIRWYLSCEGYPFYRSLICDKVSKFVNVEQTV